jgi:hypothetical protein
MILPSLLAFSQGWGLIDRLLRACNEGSPRPRVARAQEINRLHPVLYSLTDIVIEIGFRGLSNSSHAAATILSTTSMPRKTSPKTV